MEAFQGAVQFFLDLGASVFLPIIVFFLAVSFGARPGRAVRSALMVGVGFVGIGIVLDVLFSNLGPAAEALVQRFGIELSIIDVGWPAASAIAFGSNIAVLIIPTVIVLNVVLLLAKVTRTINVDIWNFWHFAFVGAIVQAITGNIWLGLGSALLFAAVILFLADWTAPAVQKLMGMPGISLPHGFSTAFVVPAMIVNAIIDRIPWLKNVEADPESIRKRFGVLGEPVLQGLIVGGAIALIAYAGDGSAASWVPRVLQVGISLAAVMVLMPRMVALLMEGLIPLSEATRDFLQKRAGNREIYIGLDSAIVIGHPTSIATSLLMIPITVVLAVILPGNRVLPFGDLATIPFMVAMMVPIVRGNVVRATITGTVVMVPTLYIMNAIAGVYTRVAHASNFEFPEGATTITSMVDGGNWLAGLFTVAANHFWVGNGLILGALIVLWMIFRRHRDAWHRVAGAYTE